MNRRVAIAFLLAACASAPKGPDPRFAHTVYDGYRLERVREATVQIVGDLDPGMDPPRIRDDGRVVADYHGWATFEVRFEELDGGVATELEIRSGERLECRGVRRLPAGGGRRDIEPYAVPIALEGGRVEWVSRDVADGPRRTRSGGCEYETRRWTGKSAGAILEAVRERLGSSGSTPALPD